jgi:hypothetical protein
MHHRPVKDWLSTARERARHARHGGAVSARLAVGLFVITMGLVLLLDSMDLLGSVDAGRFFGVALFTAIGATLLIEQRSETSKYWAYGWLTLAAIELAYHIYLLPFGVKKLFFPTLLLLLGARLVQRSMQRPATGDATGGTGTFAQNGGTRAFALLSGSEVRNFTQPLKELEATAILGGIKLNLTQTQIEGDVAHLHVIAVMGGIEILAPSEWHVESSVTPVLGAYVDKRRPTATPPSKTLRITGMAMMGGVEVKN